MKFDDSKNSVSDESKNLIVSMLQMEPKNRIDWQSFFNHPVFSKEFSGFDNSFAKAIGTLLNHRMEVDQEFSKNKESIGPEDLDKTLIDPLNLPVRDEILNPDHLINDTNITEQGDSPTHQRDSFKEYTYRYYHENNKILVIYLTVKKLRQLMKEEDFKEQHANLYLLMTVLAKKGMMLSDLTILSLVNSQNIFKLRDFEAFVKDSPEYGECLGQLKKDQKVVKDYQGYIQGLQSNMDFSEEQKAILKLCNQPMVELKVLDETARGLYQKLRTMGEPLGLAKKLELRQFYLLAMIYTIYSIKSEVYMPYLTETGAKFEWDTFKQKHEGLASEYLEKLLNNIES
jgi:hypothetical protein